MAAAFKTFPGQQLTSTIIIPFLGFLIIFFNKTSSEKTRLKKRYNYDYYGYYYGSEPERASHLSHCCAKSSRYIYICTVSPSVIQFGPQRPRKRAMCKCRTDQYRFKGQQYLLENGYFSFMLYLEIASFNGAAGLAMNS